MRRRQFLAGAAAIAGAAVAPTVARAAAPQTVITQARFARWTYSTEHRAWTLVPHPGWHFVQRGEALCHEPIGGIA